MDMPNPDSYYAGIACAVAARANCVGRRVGALIVQENRVISTGYNGTPEGMENCLEGGCTRCSDRERFKSGTAYDICVCVHAEANALAAAARFGAPVDGGTLYTTHQPCFSCSKSLLQAGLTSVRYLESWEPDELVAENYATIQGRLAATQVTDIPAGPVLPESLR